MENSVEEFFFGAHVVFYLCGNFHTSALSVGVMVAVVRNWMRLEVAIRFLWWVSFMRLVIRESIPVPC